MSERITSFKSRLTGGDPLIGTFMKTPSSIVAEVLGLSSLDAVAIDSEHAPFGRVEADGCVAALRAADMPNLVRTADDSPREIRGPFKPIRTNVPEIDISEILPMHAKIADKFSLIRSCSHNAPGHNPDRSGIFLP